jgi:multiple sugar transport system permease protein
MKPRHAPTDLAERLLAGPVVWIGLTLLTAFALGPFLWMLLTSLKDRQELYATPLQYLPVHPTFENYIDAWTSPVTPFSRFFLNSLWVCSVTMVATTVVSVLAGYAIARFRFAGRDALLLIFLARFRRILERAAVRDLLHDGDQHAHAVSRAALHGGAV